MCLWNKKEIEIMFMEDSDPTSNYENVQDNEDSTRNILSCQDLVIDINTIQGSWDIFSNLSN